LLASIRASLLRAASKVGSCLSAVFDEEMEDDPAVLEAFDGRIDEGPGGGRQQ
jgi:hypothetical protein